MCNLERQTRRSMQQRRVVLAMVASQQTCLDGFLVGIRERGGVCFME